MDDNVYVYYNKLIFKLKPLLHYSHLHCLLESSEEPSFDSGRTHDM
jgi:hypothetical protein